MDCTRYVLMLKLTMEMAFTAPTNGKKVVLGAMRQYPPKIVSSNCMELVLWPGDI